MDTNLPTTAQAPMIALILFNLFAFSRLGFGQTNVGETIVDGVRYILFDDGTASIENKDATNYNPSGFHGHINGTLTLHETVTYEGNDYTLTRIEQYAFYECENLTGQLVLPNTITHIGPNAFVGCRNLSGSLTLPPLLTEIAQYTFYGTKFTGDLTIPNAVTTIGKYAFNTNLFSSIDVGDGVTTIAERAFNGTMADQVILGRNVTTVGNYAFNYGGDSSDQHYISIECRSVIPAQLGTDVFIGHRISFESIIVPCGSKSAYLDPSYNWINNGAWDLSVSEADFQNVCIDGVYYQLVCDGHTARVMNSAFLESSQGASYSGEVVIPATVNHEGITYSVTAIAPYAFDFCQLLTSVTLGSNMQSIGYRAFGFCSSLTSITFEGMAPPSVNVDESFTYIRIVSIWVPCGATTNYQNSDWNAFSIFEGAVAEINGLSYQLLCDNTAKVLNSPNYSALTSVTIPGSVSYEGTTYAVIEIATNAFKDCYSLTDVTIHEGVASIQSLSFRNCSNLTFVTLPSTMTYIGVGALSFCTNLATINSQATMSPALGENVFFQVPTTTEVIVPCGALGAYQANTDWNSLTLIERTIFKMDELFYQIECGNTTATLIPHPSYTTLDYAGIEDFELEGNQYTVTEIAANAFANCSNIMAINIPASITTIGDHAFQNCTGLYFIFSNVEMPNSITLGEGVFEGISDTAVLYVPFCYQYDYSQSEDWNHFAEIGGNGFCDFTFTGSLSDDNSWSNPENWMYEAIPDGTGRVGIFGECDVDEDVTTSSITINGNSYVKLTVESGKTLIANDFIYNQGNSENFIIKDGAQVYHPNAGAQATVEKNITAYTPNSKNGWHLVSSPAIESFAPTADNGFLANEYDLYFYEESTHHWRNHKPNGQYANFNIEPLKGYLYANNQDVTLVFAGNLCAGNAMVNVPLYYTPTAGILKGFNLVGNPFAHNVTSFTGSNVAPEVYRMNETKDEVAVGTLSENNPLKPGEGFFVKATGDEASITFNSRATNAERSNITLEVSENGLIIDRFILKRDGAPLEKFTLNENSTRVYATEGAQDWAVAVIASEAKQSSRTEQSVNFKAAKNGTYTLTVDVENMDLDYLHLIDNLTGADVDLLTPPACGHPLSEGEAQSGAELGSNSPATDSRTPAGVPPLRGGQGESKNPAGVPTLQRGQGGFNYTFTAKTTDYESRFKLVFSADEDVCEPNAPFAYINNGNIIINGTGTLQIIDILGKELVRKELSTFNSQLSTSNFVPGVYVLRLVGGDTVRTQKIVVEF